MTVVMTWGGRHVNAIRMRSTKFRGCFRGLRGRGSAGRARTNAQAARERSWVGVFHTCALPSNLGESHRDHQLRNQMTSVPGNGKTASNNLDTVENAAATPEEAQNWAEMGLRENEDQEIRTLLGRRPNAAELAMYSVMWSEHCYDKSSKVHLTQFGEKTTEAMRAHQLVGIGQNAPVVDVGEGWAVTFKIESHNSPSYIEPFQGAATGIGGIVRDIISMGARPVAVMDQLRVGAIDHPDTARILKGAVSGLSHY